MGEAARKLATGGQPLLLTDYAIITGPIVMTAKSKLLRMDNVLIVVDDLEAAKAFFAELGMELEGETTVEGRWVDRVVGLNDVRADITMMRTPDGHSRVELTKFHTPPAV